MFISKKKQVLISLIGDYRGENVTGVQTGWFYLSRYFCAEVRNTDDSSPLCLWVPTCFFWYLLPSQFHLSSHQHLICPSSLFPSVSIICFSPSTSGFPCLWSLSRHWPSRSPHCSLCPSHVLSLTESHINGSSDRSHTSISLLSLSVGCARVCTRHEPDDHEADHSLLFSFSPTCSCSPVGIKCTFSSLSVCEFSCSSGVFQCMKCVCACVCVCLCPIKRSASLPAGSLKMKLEVDLKGFHESAILSVQVILRTT